MEEKKNASNFLKRYREKADLTQGELAEMLTVSRQSIISLEGGKSVPSVTLAMKIARLFETPIEFIFRTNEDLESICEEISNSEIENLERGDDMPRGIMPWSPWREMMSLRENVDKFFDEPFSRPSSNVFFPSVGIRETDKDLIIEADLPGVRDEDVSVEAEDDKLVIRGERKFSQESKREDYYHLETSYGTFSRVVGLPANVNAEKATAEVKDGILTVKIPKVEERKPKIIEIKAKKPEVKEIKK